MDIPHWSLLIVAGLAVLHALGLVPVVRRLRGLDPAVRFKARLDLLDAVGNLLLLGGLVLGLVVAESWFRLGFAGIALMAAVYAVKGAHLLRARRRSTP
ncbi:hypothetical protein NFX46_39195 [Streptomyces phaeoluteigriseus]|uniref:Cation transporter n=1 Tax=Streptomyces phaeoluteigriseus TaxID=114686 RepID=A0ABY4ZK17_9ACTN|nr:hypothetical protein [Streptomyces phaeoluteigriseus]USQ89239.1 hypothetical protein NFX46_39195 [Streptomyces phaeoluteigriseus]